MKSKIVLGFLILSGFGAFADTIPNSQQMHQTDSGKFELTPAINFASTKYNYGVSTVQQSSSTDTMFGFNLTGEYGINEMVSIGLRLGYQKDHYTYAGRSGSVDDTKGDGMTDPNLFINFRNDLGVGLLRYGANLAFSLGDQNMGNFDSMNEYSGGLTFTPYVGYEYAFGMHEVGARISYDLVQTDRNWDAVGMKQKVKGGNEFSLTVFYEANFNPVLLGVDVGLMSYAATSTDNAVDTGSNNNDYSAGKIDVYAAWSMTKDLVLIPTIGYDTIDNGAQLGRLYYATTGSGGPYANVALRFAF